MLTRRDLQSIAALAWLPFILACDPAAVLPGAWTTVKAEARRVEIFTDVNLKEEVQSDKTGTSEAVGSITFVDDGTGTLTATQLFDPLNVQYDAADPAIEATLEWVLVDSESPPQLILATSHLEWNGTWIIDSASPGQVVLRRLEIIDHSAQQRSEITTTFMLSR